MKHFALAFLTVLALITGVTMTSADTDLLSGAAETVITQVKDREQVYQHLYARALVLGNGEQTMAIVPLDLGTVSYEFSKMALGVISESTDIPREFILICPSQTHNAPGVDGRHLSQESSKWLAAALAQLVNEAKGDMQPASLRIGRAPAQIGYNRRLMKDGKIVMEPNPNGAVVPWVDTLTTQGRDGKRIGALFSHAAHPVIVHWSSDAIGPDFPGFAVQHLRKLLTARGEPDGIFMFTQGSCGNINGYPLRGGFTACDAAGLSLASSVTASLSRDKPVRPGLFRSRDVTLSLPQRAPSVAECKGVLAREPGNKEWERLLKMAEEGKRDYMPFPMRAIAIGDDVCILAVTGELFAEYQLFVDKTSPFKHTFVFNHVNGLSSYIATKKDYELGPAGGYEAWRGPIRSLAPETEKVVRDGMIKLLHDLKE